MRSGAQLRVMVVEDEVMMQRTVGRALAMRGYSVVARTTCAEARIAEGRFDVGIFDIDLPDGDGVALAQSLLRAGVVYSAVFFSATLSPSAVEQASRLGLFVSKTDGVMELLDAVGETIQRSIQALAVGAEGSSSGGGSEGHPVSGLRRVIPR